NPFLPFHLRQSQGSPEEVEGILQGPLSKKPGKTLWRLVNPFATVLFSQNIEHSICSLSNLVKLAGITHRKSSFMLYF
ncbi:hypothetical protein J4W51_26205, partial [Escherichia coli]